MNNILKLLVLAAILIGSIRISRADNLEKDVYNRKFAEVVSRLNRVFESRHIPVLNYDPKKLNVYNSPDYLRKITIAEVSVPGLGVDILPVSLEIISFQRDIPAEGADASEVTTPRPQWTPEEAAKESRFWYEIVMGKFPSNVGKPLVQFNPQMNLLKGRVGLWEICWPRIDALGHRFANDAINITLTEKYGLIGVANNFSSKFAENQNILVTQEEAIRIGRPIALKMLANPMASQWSKGLVLQDKASAELWIVNPNHLLQHNSIEDTALGSDLTARLAWIVTYRASNDKGMGSNVFVWIDTKTKENLGGDFK